MIGERIAFTTFGVPLEVSVPTRLEERARAVLPPAARLGPPEAATTSAVASLSLEPRAGRLVVALDGERVGTVEDEDAAIGLLDAHIRAQVALRAPEHIFVHAGVVAVEDRAVVVPGFTHSGKTTLTRALVEAGAIYYSDEFAVIDCSGRVHPYPKPLSIRHADGSGRTTETPAADLGGATGAHPLPVHLIAVTTYRPGAVLRPERLNAGTALLALLGHTIPARTRPRESLTALKGAVQGAVAWKSDRGEAAETARAIIEQLSA